MVIVDNNCIVVVGRLVVFVAVIIIIDWPLECCFATKTCIEFCLLSSLVIGARRKVVVVRSFFFCLACSVIERWHICLARHQDRTDQRIEWYYLQEPSNQIDWHSLFFQKFLSFSNLICVCVSTIQLHHDYQFFVILLLL